MAAPAQTIDAAEERAFFRDWLYAPGVFDYRTHEPEVDRFHASEAKVKIISCPARTSKSYAGWKDVLPDIFYFVARAMKGDTDQRRFIIWIVAPNYVLAKEFDYAWEDLVLARKRLGFDYRLGTKVNSPGSGKMAIQMFFGENAAGQEIEVWIEVKSAENEKVLQSEEVDVAILSEAARLPETVWTKYLSTRVGRSVWPTTPDRSAMWIYKEIERGKAHPELRIENFQFTPRANPKYKYDRYWIEHAKAEERVEVGKGITVPPDVNRAPGIDNGHDCFDPESGCRAMKDAAFAEQFGGEWTFHRGMVVPLRTKVSAKGDPAHVIHDDRPWFEWCDVHVAFDYGYADPSVVGFWLIGPEQVVLRRSIYETGLTPDDLADRVKSVMHEMKWDGRVRRMIGDPKKPDVVEVFRRRGLPIWDIDKHAQADRKAGHLTLMNFFATNRKTGEPHLLVHADCAEVIDEWSSLRYKDDVGDPYATGAFSKDSRDDAYDMARYFVQSGPPVALREDLPTLDRTAFSDARRMVLKNKANAARRKLPTVRSSGMASVGLY